MWIFNKHSGEINFPALREPFSLPTHLIYVRTDNQKGVSAVELLETAPEDARREEFADAVLRCGKAMFLCARSVLDSDADAEDAVGEAVLTAWSGYGKLREPGAIKPWLLKITLNCARQMRRRSGRVIYTDDLTPYDRGRSDREPDPPLWQAVCALPPEQRTVVTLFYYENMNLKEIARVLRLPEGTVKSRLNRARARLRELLKEDGP